VPGYAFYQGYAKPETTRNGRRRRNGHR
jgi:hypothetical protein